MCVRELDKSQAATLMLSCSLKFCGFFMMHTVRETEGEIKGEGREGTVQYEVYTVHPQLYFKSFCMSVCVSALC